MLVLALVLLAAAPAKKCLPRPAAGQWFHLSTKQAPQPSAREPNPVPIRRPLVMAVGEEGLLVLTPYLGGRYDLCTDRWKPVGPLLERAVDYGLPEPVVSEDELFFVGLGSTREPFGFFARFELATSKWRPFPREGAPRPRFDPLQAWAGGRFVILLGRDGVGGNAKNLDDGAAFEPATNTWTALANPPHTVAFEEAVPLGDQLFIWPHGFLYDVRANRWTKASTSGMGRPYLPIVEPVEGGLLALGGSWVEAQGSRYQSANDSWRQLPGLKLPAPLHKAPHVVKGVPVLVGNSLPHQGTWAGPGARFYPASSCSGAPAVLHWLQGDQWKQTTQPPGPGAGCWLTLVTAEAVFLLRWPHGDGQGTTVDGEVRAFDPTTGTWRRAKVPAKDWPGNLGEVRWDGRAFWQWGAHTVVAHAVEGQCANRPANMGCDPVVTSTNMWVDQGWRLEPVWEGLAE